MQLQTWSGLNKHAEKKMHQTGHKTITRAFIRMYGKEEEKFITATTVQN